MINTRLLFLASAAGGGGAVAVEEAVVETAEGYPWIEAG
jgi:hypothetical protein